MHDPDVLLDSSDNAGGTPPRLRRNARHSRPLSLLFTLLHSPFPAYRCCMTTFAPDTSFVPGDIDCSDWSQVEPLTRDLLERPINSVDALERWLLDRSELEAALSEAQANRYIAMTCDTESEAKKKAFLQYVEEIEPKYKPIAAALNRRLIASRAAARLSPARYEVLLRDARRDVEMFREANVPIEVELAKLDQQYQEICGAMTCDFDGQTRTLPQMMRYLEVTDRATRQAAWTAVAERRLADADRIDDLFDAMIAHRHRIALNAGYRDFRDYQHDRLRRFDYTPADCSTFHESVERLVVPLMRRLDEQRREALGLETLRPWDLAVDVLGRPPLRPFATVEQFVEGTERIFRRMDGDLGTIFASLRRPECLDLESRKGKAPGGYQYNRDRIRQPFIFMNAAGLHRDLITLLHEGGHAFHSILCADDPLLPYRGAPMEFAEVASMSMELLAHPFLDEFYSQADATRARRQHLEAIMSILPWIATIDAFQHWLYTNPGHSRDQRLETWRRLDDRFGHRLDWTGLEAHHERSWQRQLHLFGVPFYYIEYGIAQIGALQMWVNFRRDRKAAVRRYRAGLALGGSRPLPQLWSEAGLEFDFGPQRLVSLMREVDSELAALPA